MSTNAEARRIVMEELAKRGRTGREDKLLSGLRVIVAERDGPNGGPVYLRVRGSAARKPEFTPEKREMVRDLDDYRLCFVVIEPENVDSYRIYLLKPDEWLRDTEHERSGTRDWEEEDHFRFHPILQDWEQRYMRFDEVFGSKL